MFSILIKLWFYKKLSKIIDSVALNASSKDSRTDIIKSHELIDTIELNVKNKFGVELTIHMDLLVLDDDINELKVKPKYILSNIDSNLSFPDLRMIKRDYNNTILFNVVVSYNFKYSNEKIQKLIEEKLICNYKYIE